MLQKPQIRRAVDFGEHGTAVVRGLLHRTKPARPDTRQHIVNPPGHFETRNELPTEHLQPAVVQGVEMVVEGLHGVRSWLRMNALHHRTTPAIGYH